MDVNYRSATCTDCGSTVKLDTTKAESFCPSCGAKVDVAESVRKFAVLFPTRALQENKDIEAAKQRAGDAAEAPAGETPEAPPPEEAEEAVLSEEAAEEARKAAAAEAKRKYAEDLYAQAQACLNSGDHIRAAELYTKILIDIGKDEYRAHWGLFCVDERNFNVDEKLLQCFSCFPFRKGSQEIRKEILTNPHLEETLDYSPLEMRQFYLQSASKHAENIFDLHRKGCDNLIAVAEHQYGMLDGTYETTGITAAASRIGFPSGVTVKNMENNKMYFQFSVNKLGMLHLDVVASLKTPKIDNYMWHYRNILLNPENGAFNWSEFRSFTRLDDESEPVDGKLDDSHKIPFVLLALWQDKLIVRSSNKVYVCRAFTFTDVQRQIVDSCYNAECVPLMDAATAAARGAKKSSDFFYVQPIAMLYDSAKKSKWIRRASSGCFVATAVYGSYDAPEVMVFRAFRDKKLMKSIPGRTFVRFYYRFGPVFARKLTPRNPLSKLIKSLLDRLAEKLRGVYT